MTTALFKDATLQQIKKKPLETFAKIISKWAGQQMARTSAQIMEQRAVIELFTNSLVRAQISTQLLRVASYSTVSAFAGSRFIPHIQGLGSEMDADQFQNGLSNNLAANIHQVGMVGLGFTTPDKKLIYHTYISKAEAGKTDFTIYNDVGSTYNYRTVGISRKAFMGNKTVQTIKFAESRSSSYDSYESLMFTIPDSAFAGCTALREFDLRYSTARGSQQGLGPENFVLCGDSIFAGCDSTKLRIIVAEDRLQDFLDNESWRKYKRFLTTGKIEEKKATSGYGVNYAYAYKNNSTRHITYSMGHEVEHLYAYEADDNFLNKNNGALGLFNDVGNWGNYHLDYVKRGAFEGNQNLKEVSFWNVNGLTIFGESYESINITLQDKCFANCPNLVAVYLPASVTTISNSAFYNDPNLTIYCYKDSYAHTYAEIKNIAYVLLDAEPQEYIYGDANSDGYVNISDVTDIQRAVAEIDTLDDLRKKAADVNGDGVVTIDDATILQMYLAEFATDYPIGVVTAQ